MHHVIELHFDDQTEAVFDISRKKLRDEGLDVSDELVGLRPHVTLCSSEPLKLVQAQDELLSLFSDVSPFTLEFSSLGLFIHDLPAPILYAGVSSSEFLCKLHSEVFKIVKRHSARVFDFAAPGIMVFHSTLSHALPSERISDAVKIIREVGFPKQGQVVRAAIVQYFPATEVWGTSLGKDS